MKPKEIFYGRIVYCLGGANDSYPTTTAGRKTFSSEISGRFIQVDWGVLWNRNSQLKIELSLKELRSRKLKKKLIMIH